MLNRTTLVSSYFFVWSLSTVPNAARGKKPADAALRSLLSDVRHGPRFGLRDGLLALGYRENTQFTLGVRFTQANVAVLPAAARQLVDDGVDLIFASDVVSAKVAQMATTQIPIVFAGVGDLLGLGLIQSFARPGGIMTGVIHLDTGLGANRLKIFRDTVPGLKRILFAYNQADDSAVQAATTYREATRLGIVLVEQPVHTQEEAQTMVAQAQRDAVDGLLKPPGTSLNTLGFILAATSQQIISGMFDAAFWVERGGLASYGPNYDDSGRLAARLVDNILIGAKPAQIPVAMNAKIKLVINLQVAKALGLTIAPEVRYVADRLIR